MRKVFVSLVISLLACWAYAPAHATKACMPSPCAGANGSIDAGKCAQLAAWIATGAISGIVHHEEGDPLFKDFADFTFTVQATEKGGIGVGQKLKFQVGWCENWQTLPKDTSGLFRFYGLPLPTDATLPNQYLYFEQASAGHQ